MTKYQLIALLSCLVLPSTMFAQPVARSGYDIAWTDEFDGIALDTSRWIASSSSSGGGNQSLEHYLPEMVTVSDGRLVITSNDIPTALKPYRSGLIETNNYQKYGRWDVRAKLPGTKGTWPAIWLLSNNAIFPWPSRGEIDIMENRGNEPQTTSSAFHFGTNPPYAPQFLYANQSQVQNGTSENFHSGFHVYSMEWDPDQIRFYVDDVHHYTVRDSDVDGFLTGTGQFKGGGVDEMRLIINTAIGGTFLDNPDGTSVWPQTHEVDYVHAYTKSASPPVLTLDNGGFEDQGGSLAHWSTYGNGGLNISTIDGPTGGKALKVYGQFNGNTNFSGVEQGISVIAGSEICASAEAFVPTADSLIGTANQLELKIDYYNKLYGKYGSSNYIGTDSIILANAESPTGQWFDEEIRSTTPVGAVEARVSIVFRQVANAGGSVCIDNVKLETVPPDSSLTTFDSDFDSLIPAPTIGDGWKFINSNGPSAAYSGDAPNGPQICTLVNAGAGNQFLNMFADYDNKFMPTEVLTLHVFQEQTFTAVDAARGEKWTFNFDYSRAVDPFGPGGATATGAFIRVFDDGNNLLAEELFSTTAATGPAFSPGSVSLTFDPVWNTDGIVQFGFTSSVTNYEPSGVYYDNVEFTPVETDQVVLGDANGDGVLNNLDIASFVLALTNLPGYQAMFPDVDPDVVLDMNNDGRFDNLDIAAFVAALTK